MFTISWYQDPVYVEGSVKHPTNGYWYSDETYRAFATVLSGGISYSGSADTVEVALANLRTQIEAGLSKNRDKPVLEALDAFDAASK